MNQLHNTPFYQYYPEKTEENIRIFNKFRDCNISIFYAIKANSYEPLLQRLIREGYGFDFASREELEYVVSLGADPKKTSFSSPTKLPEDLKIASGNGVPYYAFDSEEEIIKIMANVKDPFLVARISTKNDTALFNLSQKFGMTKKYYKEIAKKAKENDWPIKGVTFHVGSQNGDVGSWKKALVQVEEIIEISKKNGLEITSVNLGGGIPAQYDDNVESVEHFVDSICELVEKFRQKNNIEDIIIEPGRSLAANTMSLFTKIVNIKPYKVPPVIIVDTSVFNGLIEPLEHFEYPINYIGKGGKTAAKQNYRIGGISCDGYDIIKKKCLLPKDVEVGEILEIPLAGAYTFVYENFHMRSFPPIYNS